MELKKKIATASIGLLLFGVAVASIALAATAPSPLRPTAKRLYDISVETRKAAVIAECENEKNLAGTTLADDALGILDPETKASLTPPEYARLANKRDNAACSFQSGK